MSKRRRRLGSKRLTQLALASVKRDTGAELKTLGRASCGPGHAILSDVGSQGVEHTPTLIRKHATFQTPQLTTGDKSLQKPGDD